MQDIKLVVVGDSYVGKSYLLSSYATNSIPSRDFPTVSDNYSCHVVINEESYAILLWDTSGNVSYNRSYKYYM